MSSRDANVYLPGDLFPNLALPGRGGGIVDLNRQAFAGRAVVLWLTGPEPDSEVLAALDSRRDVLATLEALAFVVAVGGRADALRASGGDAVAGPPILCDPDGLLARGVGLDGPGGVVVDANRRLSAVLAADAFDEAVAVCRRLFDAGAPVVIEFLAPVLLIPGVLEPELCRRLIDFWEAGEKVADAVADSRGGQIYSNVMLKKRRDVTVSDPALMEQLRHRLRRRVVHDVRKAYGSEFKHFEAFRIGCYDSATGGYFRRHRDNTSPSTSYRKLAISINLNTGEYSGGELRFPEYGRQLYLPDTGGAVVFSCSLLHEALPVTEGRRFGMFGFFIDEAGEARFRELGARERAARGPATPH